jgi:L-fuculose-phosphate aldolase
VLRFHNRADEAALRAAIVECGRIAYQRGLLAANDGNISVRMADGNVLITPSGLCKGRLQAADLLVVDPDGTLLRPAADPRLRVTSEQPMHLEVYRRRDDVHAVLHAHPPYAVALTVAGRGLRNDLVPEVILLIGAIPVTHLALPASPEDAEVIRELIAEHDVIMLRQHGSLTVGRNLDEALIHLERLEQVAQVQLLAEMMGNVQALPAEMQTELWQMHARMRARS